MSNLNRKAWFPIIIWASVFFMFYSMINYFQPWDYAIISASFTTFTLITMYYVTVLYLFPRYYILQRKNYFHISIVAIFFISILFFCIDIYLLPDIPIESHERPPIYFHFARYVMSMVFVFFVGTSSSLMQRTTVLMEKEKLLTEEKLDTELKLLKAQINPHFIFNALNNIYSLTYMKSKNAPESVLKLSEMLRYVFYDCSKDRVPLSAELKYIENFNAFQQMKSEYKQNISLHIDTDSGVIEIAPMLFITFIENAYKYSRIEENEDAFVNINIKSNSSSLHFNIINSIPENTKSKQGSGMGIKNVKHRLAIIYPEKHNLTIEEKNNSFSVDLVLET